VNALEPPLSGERWVSDAQVRGLGIRLWAGKKGGSSCYAIRVRDNRNRVVRESFSIWSNWFARRKIRDLVQQEEFDFQLGHFLDEAREWAQDRIHELKGGQQRRERRQALYRRASIAAQRLTISMMAERVLTKLERSGKNLDYVVQLRKLFWRLSDPVRSSLMTKMSVSQLAKEITNPTLPIMQSRALQSFIGQLYSRLAKWYGPSRRIAEKINQQISTLREKQSVPHPEILGITADDYTRFLNILSAEREYWRESLAIQLYFETGAKMRRVLRAKWDQIIDNTWYPYSASEREFWFVGREPLSESAKATLNAARERISSEGRTSDYVFPRKDRSKDGPITAVRRYWTRVARDLGWEGLPLSHVVVRHNRRNTPSYMFMYSYMWVPLWRDSTDPRAVSKFGKPASHESEISTI
jgi:hypothetical protein